MLYLFNYFIQIQLIPFNKKVLIFFFVLLSINSFSQSLPSGYPVFEENFRRLQISGDSVLNESWLVRPNLQFDSIYFDESSINIGFVPFRSTVLVNTNRPYWNSTQGMIPSKGGQVYLSGGAFINYKYFQIDFQPEINLAQNLAFDGFEGFDETEINRAYFVSHRRGDQPELYGNGAYSRFGLGQSKVVGKFGAFEIGVSSQNIWWGPGQWNALTFSNNAPGFPRAMIKTHRPAKTFFGTFEVELLSGVLKSKKLVPTQNDELNNEFFEPIRNKPRYLNALLFTIQPKWIEGLSFGASRTVQTFTDSVNVKKFIDVFPVFWGLTKESVGSDLVGESDRGRDQQITVFFRYVIPKFGVEFYGEFGRRDHALNWRDLILSPSHSRSYLLGFNKIFKIEGTKFIQLRSEITHQQQSINWLVRPKGQTSWHSNATVGGFSNLDQSMGVGIGLGSNVEILELSFVNHFDKIGLYFERLGNNQDLFDKIQMDRLGYRPWIDYSSGILFDKKFERFIISTRNLFTYTNNYQWSQSEIKDGDFYAKNPKVSFHSNLTILYFFK